MLKQSRKRLFSLKKIKIKNIRSNYNPQTSCKKLQFCTQSIHGKEIDETFTKSVDKTKKKKYPEMQHRMPNILKFAQSHFKTFKINLKNVT